MTQPSEEAIRKACEEAGVQWSPDLRKFWFTAESKLVLALARRIEAEREAGWQTMDTAPTDGTWVQTWGPHGYGIAKWAGEAFPYDPWDGAEYWQPIPAAPPKSRTMREKLEAAWDTIARERGLSWASSNASRFTRLLDAEAWLDAAMMLVPEGAGLKLDRYWIASVDGAVWSAHIFTGGIPSNPARVYEWHDAPSPAEALLAAIEKARTV